MSESIEPKAKPKRRSHPRVADLPTARVGDQRNRLRLIKNRKPVSMPRWPAQLDNEDIIDLEPHHLNDLMLGMAHLMAENALEPGMPKSWLTPFVQQELDPDLTFNTITGSYQMQATLAVGEQHIYTMTFYSYAIPEERAARDIVSDHPYGHPSQLVATLEKTAKDEDTGQVYKTGELLHIFAPRVDGETLYDQHHQWVIENERAGGTPFIPVGLFLLRLHPTAPEAHTYYNFPTQDPVRPVAFVGEKAGPLGIVPKNAGDPA